MSNSYIGHAGRAIGIDLGTTKSVIAVMQAGKPIIIPNAEGDRLTPSVVAFKEDGECLVGLQAKRQAVNNPDQTILSVKRFIGMDEVLVGKRKIRPAEVSALILKKLKADAEAYLGEKVTDAVITVPAYFNERQRQFTKDAGRIAGFNVLRIISEPTAAALAYGFGRDKEAVLAIYHLGGGTFDISILDMGDGVFQVKSTNGDTHLGGDDFDWKLIDHFADEFKKVHQIDLRKGRKALLRLWEAVECAKCRLTTQQEAEIDLPYIITKRKASLHLRTTLTRDKLEQLTHDLVQKTLIPCGLALKDAGIEASGINDVILVGGQTRMPLVQEKVKEFFGKQPRKGVHPEEAVALGAALMAGILQGQVIGVLLLDVIPMTLTIETVGGIATPLVERNFTIPVRHSQIFTTSADNQTNVEIRIFQGERPMVADNILLGHILLKDLPPAPKGIPQIEVTFDVDANAILRVSAKDLASGKKQKITLVR